MAKLTLQPNPTFVEPVEVRLPGGEIAKLNLTFRYRKKSEIGAWQKSLEDKSTIDQFKSFVDGWVFPDVEFNDKNISEMFDAYPSFANDATQVYINALYGVRTKN